MPTSTTLLTITAFAYEFQMSRDTVRRRLADANVEPVEKQHGRDVYSLREAIPALTGGVDGDPFKHKARMQARLLELQLAQREGELLERHDVEQEQARILRAVALWADTAVDVLERDAALTTAQATRFERCLDALRNELYRTLKEAPDDDDTATRGTRGAYSNGNGSDPDPSVESAT
jgi:hypothetical protein